MSLDFLNISPSIRIKIEKYISQKNIVLISGCDTSAKRSFLTSEKNGGNISIDTPRSLEKSPVYT